MKTRLIIAIAILLSAWQLKAQVTLPEPVAGKAVTKDYITQNLVYPDADLKQGNSGKVVVGLVEFSAKSYKRYWKRHERPVVPLTLEADTSNKVFEYKQLEEVARPYFADGSNMAKYIATHLKFPAEAKEREIQGTVRLNFVVETDGTASNIVVVNSVGGGCDQEAIRLLQETIWIPAQKNEQYVRSHNMQDITFSIGNREFQDGYNF